MQNLIEFDSKWLGGKLMNNKQFLDTMINSAKRKAQESGQAGADFYSGEYEEYFAQYVQKLYENRNQTQGAVKPAFGRGKSAGQAIEGYKATKKLDTFVPTTAEALSILNENFLRDITGSYLTKTRKEYNIERAYHTYKNAVAFTEIELAKKYGAENYYEMPYSQSTEAKEAFANFENWQKQKDAEFEELAKIDVEMLKFTQNPQQYIAEGGILGIIGLTGLGAVLGLGAAIATDYVVWLDDTQFVAIIAVGAVIGSIWGYFLEQKFDADDYAEKLNAFAKELGYNDYASLTDAINKNVYSYLTEEEAQQVHAFLVENNKENFAISNGFENFSDLQQQIDANTVIKNVSSNEALDNIALERKMALEGLANKNGFVSGDEMMKYLDSQLILEGKVEDGFREMAGWSEFAYKTPTAKSIAIKLDNVNEYYDETVDSIKTQNWPQEMEVVTDENLKQLSISLNAQEQVVNATYESLLTEDGNNIFYSNSELTHIIGTETTQFFENQGKEFPDGLDKNAGYNSGDYDSISSGADMNIDNFDTSLVLDGALGGMAVGAGVSLTAKYANQIKNSIKSHKINKQAEALSEIDNQVQADEQTR